MEKLGVFDSGLGGFNVVTKLRETLNLDIVFLADHKNLPYGTKSDDDLKSILSTNMKWFQDKGINHVLIACNTASNFIDYLRLEFPELTIDSIIEITSKQFHDEDLIIFGTQKTATLKMYDQELNKHHEYLALSDLASLVEAHDDVNTLNYLKRELSQYKNKDNNYLLACTHYSIVHDMFDELLSGVIYDSIQPVLDYYEDETGSNTLEVYSTGNIKILKDQVKSIFNYDVDVIPHLDEYKIVVVSDNHGLYDPLVQALEDNKDASLFVHCGDVELNDPILDNFYVVNGNNDYLRPFVDNITLNINGLIIHISHGHEVARFQRLENLNKFGASIHAKIVLYGHEHVFKESWIDGRLLLNPGSLFYNRDNTSPSYAIITVNKEGFSVKRVDV